MKTMLDVVGAVKTYIDNEVSLDPKEITVDYSDIISITDAFPKAAKDVKLKVDSVQDLHGYDNPWVGGVGKNKIPLSVTKIKAANTSGTWNENIYSISDGTIELLTDNNNNVTGLKVNGTFSADTYFRVSSDITLKQGVDYKLNGCTTGTFRCRLSLVGNTSSSEAYDNTEGDVLFTAGQTSYRATIIINSGYVANNIVFKPMIRLATVSDATYEPYENICPISGWTGANLADCRINQWDEEWENGGFDGAGNPFSSNSWIRSKNYCICKPNTDYCAWQNTPSADLRLLWFDSSKNYIKMNESTIATRIFTSPANACYFKLCKAIGSYNGDISINYPSTETAYHAYTGQTYEINLNGTRYGGTLDVTSGVLTVTHALQDLGLLNWSVIGAHGFFVAFPSGKPASTNALPADIISSYYETSSYNDVAEHAANMKIALGKDPGGDPCLMVNNDFYSDVAEFKTAMSGVQLVYELATPQTIQLTPTEVQLLLGYNTLFADTGDIQLTYNPATFGNIVEEVGELVSQSQALTNQLTDEKETRAALGAHNFLNNQGVSGTYATVNFTMNADGTISVASGTFSSDSAVSLGYITLDAGTYYISNGNNSQPRLQIVNEAGTSQLAVTDGTHNEFVLATKTKVLARIVFSAGAVSSKTLYPMIRLATDADPTYQPYAMTNKELTDAIGKFKLALIEGDGPSSSDSYEHYSLYNVSGIICKWFTILSAEKHNTGNNLWYEIAADVGATEYVAKASVDDAGNFRVKFSDVASYNKFRAIVMYY